MITMGVREPPLKPPSFAAALTRAVELYVS
jgi:hypothetical protein